MEYRWEIRISSDSEKIENCICKEINVITVEQELMLEMVEKIENEEEKMKFIRRIIEKEKNKKIRMVESDGYNLNKIIKSFAEPKEIGTKELQEEIKSIKSQIRILVEQNQDMDTRINKLEKGKEKMEETEDLQEFVNSISLVSKQKWYSKITLKIGNFQRNFIALIDSGADLNCIQEGLVPTKYFEKTTQRLTTASKSPLRVRYKIPIGHVCKEGNWPT